MPVGMAVAVRRWQLDYERSTSISLRFIDVAFRQEDNFRLLRHFDFADGAKSFTSEGIRLQTLLSKAPIAHDFLQDSDTGCLFIVWVVPFSHSSVFFGVIASQKYFLALLA